MAYNNNHQPTGAEEQRRLFTALWPDEPTRRELARCRDRQQWGVGSRLVAAEDWHVTLTFLGRTPAARIPTLSQRLAAIDCPAVEWHLDRLECWDGGLVVLASQRWPAALIQLHEHLQAVHRALGLPLESRPYRPHVTLARHAAGTVPAQLAVPVRWLATRFVLAESRPRQPYRILHRFGGEAPAR